MAKKTSSVHIEEYFWSLIEEYQNSKGIQSRNTALENILTEWNILKKLNLTPNTNNEIKTKDSNIDDNNEIKSKKDDGLDSVINNIYSGMSPD